MRYLTSLLRGALFLIFCNFAPADELLRLNLDDASDIGLRIETDADSQIEGQTAIKITTGWPTTVNLAEVRGPDIENATLIYSAKVKTQLEGTAFLELWAHVGGGQYFSRGFQSTVGGDSDWQTIQTPFLFQQGQKPEKVTLNLVINGKGTVWVDEIVLSRGPLN